MGSSKNENGVQFVPQIAAQTIYLDFDGELTRYNGESLSIDKVEVQNSCLTAERIQNIVAQLNARYAVQNITFVTERPLDCEYSTVFIGKTDAFSAYGNFAGVAETIDKGNENKSDNAFVLLDAASADEEIVRIISHETGHLTGSLDHGGSGLAAYAAETQVGAGSTYAGTINKDDTVTVTLGGRTLNVTVNNGGYFVISGGAANSTTINSGGDMQIWSGGSANPTTVNGHGVLNIQAGGIAGKTTVNSYGSICIFKGGVANDTLLSGYLYFYGETSRHAIMKLEGGTANKTTVSGATITVYHGGVLSDTTVERGGRIIISSGGTATAATFTGQNSNHSRELHNADLHIHEAGLAAGMTFNSAGRMYVYNGGSATDAVINSAGSAWISSGGVAAKTTLNSAGYFHIADGGSATNIVWTPTVGTLEFGDEAVLTFTSAYTGVYYGSNHKLLTSVTEDVGRIVSNAHSMFVMSTGVLKETQINAGGAVHIWNGGVAESATVNKDGKIIIYSGGVVNTLTAGGSVHVRKGAEVNGMTVNTEGKVTVTNGGIVKNTAVSAGTMSIANGGMASATVITGGSAAINSGGVMSQTTVSNQGLQINSGGKHIGSLTIASGGKVNVASGGIVDFNISEYTPEDGYLLNDFSLVTGAPTFTVTVTDYQINGEYKLAQNVGDYLGTISVGNGSTVFGSEMIFDKTISYNDTSYTFKVVNNNLHLVVSATSSGPVVSGGLVNIYSGGQLVSSGDAITGASVGPGYYMYASASGSAVSATILSGGMLYVSKGAVISDLNVRNGGVAIFSSGATLQGTQNFGGTILLSGSVDASAAQVSLDISERKTSADIIISNLTLLNTTNYSITVSEMQSKGLYKLASGASAFEGTITICTTNGVCYDPISIGDTLTANAINRTFTLVESAGILYVSAGIMPGKVNIYYNDELVIANNAVSGITLNNDPDNAAALMNITSGGSAVATQVKTGGIMRVSSSGRATSTTLQNGGIMRLSSGAQGYNTLVNYGGSAHASSGAVLSKTVINSGGKAFAEKTAEISDVTVSGGGTLYVSSGSILQGSVYIAGALNISGSVDATGADLVLDLTSRKNSAGAMISSLDDLNIANFTVTISSTPEAGSYLLAENASNYTGSITVGDGNLDFGTLTIGGETFNYRYATYGLSVDQNGALSLDIVSQEPAVFVYSDETLVSAGPELNDIKLTAGRLNSMCISSGGVANNTIVSGGILDIFGGMANSTTLFNRGAMNVFSGGMANSTTINFRGTLNVSGGIVNRTTVLSSGGINILKDGVANQTLLESKGYLKLTGGTASATTIGNDGNMHIYAGTAVDTTIQNGDLNVSGGSVKNTVVGDNGYMQLLGGVTHTGTLQIAQSGMVVAATQATVEFTVAGRTTSDDYLINDLSKIIGTPNYTILVADDQALGTYKLAQGAGAFTGSISVSTSTTSLFDLEVNGEDILRDGVNWSLDQVDGALTLTVNTLLTGDKNGTYFSRIQDTVRSVELSADDFASALLITPVSKAVDAYGMPAGSWKWQACTENTCQEISSFVSDNTTEPQVLVSDADGDTDVFFANAVSTWRSGYAAEHQGTLNGWTGTEEQVLLEGKNKIADVFTGSNDANVLVLTDGTNGDALFVDDIYTAFGKDAARLSEINEIRAGAGNDIVDLTSQRYSLAGTGVKVFGGSGDDTIWANSGSNTLFGDAGNDRIVGASGNDFIIGGSGDDSMLGGGGEDTFFFGSNWGNDTIEQLSGGKVTLHFENGSESNWNAETLTYSDGTNSVTVSGVEEVTLVFGEDASVAGAFLDAASEKIFEDKNKGMIA